MQIKLVKSARDYIYRKFIEPRSENLDDRRREYILNIIFSGLSVISIFNFISATLNHIFSTIVYDTYSLAITGAFMCLVLLLFWLSRHGFYKFAAISIVALLGFIGLFLVLTWSFELPIAELIFVLVIVMSGVLFRATTALLIAFGVSVLVMSIGLAQVYGHLHPYTEWFNHPLKTIDVVGYVAFFLIIGIVTWLANRQIDSSLDRARASEASLEIERDSLEIKVIERTRALEQAQLVRVMELQRFAEFGRLSAGLLHDLTNPLTVASLNLEQLGNKHRSRLIARAINSLHHIERYVEAARKQLKSQGDLVNFSVNREIKQIIGMLNNRAQDSGLKIKLSSNGASRLYGDPVKFNQLIANLIMNAIEAYDTLSESDERRPIVLSVQRQGKWVKAVIHDWGHGLDKDELNRIFEPFYSTKPKEKRNMGIGLAMVKQIATVDFKGRIKASSSKRYGTKFTVYLTGQENSK